MMTTTATMTMTTTTMITMETMVMMKRRENTQKTEKSRIRGNGRRSGTTALGCIVGNKRSWDAEEEKRQSRRISFLPLLPNRPTNDRSWSLVIGFCIETHEQ